VTATEWTWRRPAAAALQGLTAHYYINSTFPVASGQTEWPMPGPVGVGLLLIQLLRPRARG
jgi:NADPH2:quinone reductase